MNQPNNATTTMLAGTAISDTIYYMTGTLDDLVGETIFTRMFIYDDSAASSSQWFHHDLPGWAVISTCLVPATSTAPRQACSLSEEGDVEFYSSAGSKTEKINGAGAGNAEGGRGHMTRIRHIGYTLYACGYAGQVYKRQNEKWERFDAGIEDKIPASFNTNDNPLDLIDIHGLHEADIYTVGSDGFIAHYDGNKWSVLSSATDACLYGILVQSESEVWIAGSNGTVLRGSAKSGFKLINRRMLDCDFYSIARFNNDYYIGASDGLYIITHEQIMRVDLSEQLIEVDSVEEKNGALWALSSGKLIKYDGITWKSIEHIDNN